MKIHRWIFLAVLAGCVQQPDCLGLDGGGQDPYVCAGGGNQGTYVSGPAGSTACECPSRYQSVYELEGLSCRTSGLVCEVTGFDCLCEGDGTWHCDGVPDLAVPMDLSRPDA
jgi:hypothetical protein